MRYLIFITFLIAGNISNAQCSLSKTIKGQFVKDWQLAKELTMQYLAAMPDVKYGFNVKDSVRTFAQQMLHLAQVNGAMISHATGLSRPSSLQRNLERSQGAQSKDSVIYYINVSYNFAIDAIQKMDESKFEEIVKHRNMEETRFSWLLKAFAHQTHHRGQAAIYIRLAQASTPKWLE